jgi:hypothetical protein
LTARVSLACLAGCLLLVSACSERNRALTLLSPQSTVVATATASIDVSGLVLLAQQALQQAQTIAPNVVLRQVDIVWASQQHIFRFTDGAAKQEIIVNTLNAATPPQQWQVLSGYQNSPLVGPHPPAVLNLRSLRIGPQAAAATAVGDAAKVGYASNAQPIETTLIDSEGGPGPLWYVTVGLPGGEAQFSVNPSTGAVTQLGPLHLPTAVPATATPPTTPTPSAVVSTPRASAMTLPADPQTLVGEFMAARLHNDAEAVCSLAVLSICEPAHDAASNASTLLPPSNPCWYRYVLTSLTQASPITASAVVRIYEHEWQGDVGGGPPRSWEQELDLRATPRGWQVAGLGPRQNLHAEDDEPHGPHLSACINGP